MSKRVLKVELGDRSYPIRIGAGLLGDLRNYGEAGNRQVCVITDANVATHYLTTVLNSLHLNPADALVLLPGEPQKTWNQVSYVLDWLLAQKLARDACIVALGGGVIGDLAGFCAAIYQRGIDFVQIPTTLLAQVDSSVGGKTGVNHALGKNLIGAFHQPVAVIADTDTLKTLPTRELLAGLAEVIKYGMLADPGLFDWLERNLDRILTLEPETLAETVERCCAIKAGIVGLDERESGGPRALLNLGHTFGHPIETHTGYTEWLHGEAIAVGLVMAADLSARHGWIKADDAARCERLIARSGLPARPPPGLTPERFHELMGLDKKVRGGKLRLVLLRGLGQAELTADFDDARLQETLEHFCGA